MTGRLATEDEGDEAPRSIWDAGDDEEAWIAAAESWAAEVRGLRAAHRFTQACVAERAWRLSGLSDVTAVVEPAVAAMKIAGRAGRGGALFAPLARRRTQGGARPLERLRGFYADIAAGCAEALIALERMQSWRARADDAIADLSGRTPRLTAPAVTEVCRRQAAHSFVNALAFSTQPFAPPQPGQTKPSGHRRAAR